MPEWVLLDHLAAIDQIEAAERMALQSALLYTSGYQMKDAERRGYEHALDLAVQGGKRPPRAPKITPQMLERLGGALRGGTVTVKSGDEEEGR